MTLAEWVLAALLAVHPIDRVPQIGGVESEEQTRARYREIAATIAEVAQEDPAIPGGLSDRDEAALLLAIAIGETGLARDADVGPCFRGVEGGASYASRCDRGRAASVWQVHGWRRPDGSVVTTAELFADRKLAARRDLVVARGSLWLCRKLGLSAEDGLSALSGRCQIGLRSARSRWRLWNRIRVWRAD